MATDKDLGFQRTGALSQAERLQFAADDLKAVKESLEKADESSLFGLVSSLVHYGEHGAAPAFTSFSSAWIAEVEALEGALRELKEKIGVSSRGYRGTDHQTRDDMNTIRSRVQGY